MPIVFLLSATPVVGVQLSSSKVQQIEPDSQVFTDSAHHTPGSILYVSIFDPNFNRDKDVRDSIDLTQIVEGNPIVEVKILQPTKGTLTLSAVDGTMKDSNGNTVRKAVESGPDTSLFEFAVKLPSDMETNSVVNVLYHDPFAITTSKPETASSSSNGVTAFLYTDKAEVSLGQDLTIFLEEPDANLDSRTVESIPLKKVLISTDKFDETPLDIVLDKTGIETDHSSLRETGPNTGVFEVMLENINSKLADRDSEIRIVFFDETPSSGGPPIRVETVVPVVPAKIGIAFNKKQYSPFEEVKIALIAQMFNVDRNKVDIVKDKVVVSTSSGQTFHPTMIETEVDTGIFVGKVQLTSNQTEKQGDLLVKSGDILRVSAGMLGFQVSDSATISEPFPNVAKEVEPSVTMKVEPDKISIPDEAGWAMRLNITVTSSVPTTIELKVFGLPNGIWTHFLPERIESSVIGTAHLVLVGAKYVPHGMLPDSFNIISDTVVAHGSSVSVPIIKLPPPSPPAAGTLIISVKPAITIQKGSIHHVKGVINNYSMFDKEPISITPDVRLLSMKDWSTEPLPDWLQVKIKSTPFKIHDERSSITSAKFLIKLTASKDAPRGDYLLLISSHCQEKACKTISDFGQKVILLHVK